MAWTDHTLTLFQLPTKKGSANHSPAEKTRISHIQPTVQEASGMIQSLWLLSNGLEPQHSAQDYHSWMSNFLTLQVGMKSKIFTH